MTGGIKCEWAGHKPEQRRPLHHCTGATGARARARHNAETGRIHRITAILSSALDETAVNALTVYGDEL